MRNSLILFLLAITGSIIAQDSTTCKVYQYYGTDSSVNPVVKWITFNAQGKIRYERVQNYAEQEITGFIENGSSFQYTYNDTMIAEVTETHFNGPTIKRKYEYDIKGKRIRESIFIWEMNQSSGPMHYPVTVGAPADPGGTWKQVSEARITYDDKGRKILWDASRLHNTAENMYKWEYDDQNRITSYQAYNRGGRLNWKNDYQYFDWGYRFWTIKYDVDGTPCHELEPGQGYQPMIFHTITYDKNGRVLEDKVSDEKSNSRGRSVYWYDWYGRKTRVVYYNSSQEQSVTHTYRYSK